MYVCVYFYSIAPQGCNHEDGGTGCRVTHHVNSTHPHEHTYEVTVTQPIADYHYLDLTALEVWQVNELEYDANEELTHNGDTSINPKTTVRSYYSCDTYESGNGRLVFSTTTSKSGTSGYLGDVEQQVYKYVDGSSTDSNLVANCVKSEYLDEVNEDLHTYFENTFKSRGEI